MSNEQKRTENDWRQNNDSQNTEEAKTKSTSAPQSDQQHHKGGIHNNALYAAGMGRAATAQVDPHSNSGLAQTGTNTSYEGATAPGSGGSAGNGYTSGQSGVDSSISSDSDFDKAHVSTPNNQTNEQKDNEDDAKNSLI